MSIEVGVVHIMLFAPTLADRAILPTAWEGRYFFNKIGQKRTRSADKIFAKVTVMLSMHADLGLTGSSYVEHGVRLY